MAGLIVAGATLVGTKLSQPTRACAQVARMLRLPVQFRQVLPGEIYSAEFRRLNPNSKIPVLQSGDGFTLYESTSIARHLCRVAEQRGGPPSGSAAEDVVVLSGGEPHLEAYVPPGQLYPTNLRRRAKVTVVVLLLLLFCCCCCCCGGGGGSCERGACCLERAGSSRRCGADFQIVIATLIVTTTTSLGNPVRWPWIATLLIIAWQL